MEPEDKLVGEFFGSVPADARPLPSPHLIWWKAEISRRHRLAERSVAPMRFVQWAALLTAGFLLTAALVPLALPPMMWLGAGAAFLFGLAGVICARVLV